MAPNQQAKTRTHFTLWDTNPYTFVAQEAVKRHDLRRCHLSDDAIMKLAINQREQSLQSAAIDVFESVSIKSLRARGKRKRRGAPALAPDGSVMSIRTGHIDNDSVVLNGGDTSLPDGGWTVDNYHTKTDHPDYNEWLSRIVWTADEAVNMGIPREAINTPFPDMKLVANQNLSGSQPNNINDNSNVQDEQVKDMTATQANVKLETRTSSIEQTIEREPSLHKFTRKSGVNAARDRTSTTSLMADTVSSTGSIEQTTEREATPLKSTRNSGVNAARVRTPTASLMADRTNTKGPLTSANRPHASIQRPSPAVGQVSLPQTASQMPGLPNPQTASQMPEIPNPQTASQMPTLPNPLKRKSVDLYDRTITFKVKCPKLKHGEEASFNFSESLLLEKAPAFYTNLKKTVRRVRGTSSPIYEVGENPKLFEAILYWIDHGVVMVRPYLAHSDLETYYLDLFRIAVEDYELPGLSNAVIDALHEWHSRGDVVLEMIDVAYNMLFGEGLKRFYFDCLLEMSCEEFEGLVIDDPDVLKDLFQAAKMGAVGHGVKRSEAYHGSEANPAM